MGDLREQVAAYRAQHGCSLEEAMDAVVRTPPAPTYTEADMRAAIVRGMLAAAEVVDRRRSILEVGAELSSRIRALAADPAAIDALMEPGG